MKAKYLFAALSLSALLFSCSKEEINVSPEVANDGDLIEVGENFAIAGGFSDIDTKSMWHMDDGLRYMFLPHMAAGTEIANSSIAGQDVVAPEVGLCLYIDGSVYTNYEFIHDGWLKSNAHGAEFEDCNGPLRNGWRYEDASGIPGVTAITDMDGFFADYAIDDKSHNVYSNGVRGGELKEAAAWFVNSSVANAPVAGDNVFPVAATETLGGTEFDPSNTASDRGNIDLNSGVYVTENKSIFAGQYIVYAPYNQNFLNAGSIKATSELNFEDVPTGLLTAAAPKDFRAMDAALTASELADNTFSYGVSDITKGGTQVSNFNLHNLSGMIQMEIETGDDYENAGGEQITKVALINANGFVREVQLNPAAMVAEQTSQALYAGGKVTNAVLVAAVNPFVPSGSEGDKQIFYIPVFPTDLPEDGISLILYRDDDATAFYNNVPVGTATTAIESSHAYTVNVVINDDNFATDTYYVVDEETLMDAATAVASTDANAIITLLGDIEISQNIAIESFDEDVKVTVNGGSIIVPESNVATEGIVLNIGDGVVFNAKVTLEGVSCCGGCAFAGNLLVNDANVNGEVDMKAPEEDGDDAPNVDVTPGTYSPTKIAPKMAYVHGTGDIDINQGELVAMNGVVDIEGDLTIAGDALVNFAENVTVDGDVTLGKAEILGVGAVNFAKDLDVSGITLVASEVAGSVANMGTVTVRGTYTNGAAILFEEGALVNFNNVENNGLFTLNADNDPGQQVQRTIVNVAGTLNNRNEIEVNKATGNNVADFDAKLNITRTGVFNNLTGAETRIGGVLAILGDATNNVGATIVDKVSSQVTGNISKLGGSASYGEYISEVDNPHIRWTVALAERPTSTLRFVGSADVSYDMTRVQAIGRDYIKTSGLFEVSTDPSVRTVFYGPQTYGPAPSYTPTAGSNAPAQINNLDIVSGDVVVSVGAAGATQGLLTNLTVNDINVEDGNDLTFTNNAASMSVRRAQLAVLVNGELNLLSSPIGAGSDLLVTDGTFVKIANLNINSPVDSKATFQQNTKTIVKNIDNKGVAEIIFATGGSDVNGMLWYTETSTGDGDYPNGVPTSDPSVVW